MVRTFLKVYMELGSYFLFLQEQIKDIIIIIVQNNPECPMETRVRGIATLTGTLSSWVIRNRTQQKCRRHSFWKGPLAQ
jgi:hypothetical protein